jgi:hypothetical protein
VKRRPRPARQRKKHALSFGAYRRGEGSKAKRREFEAGIAGLWREYIEPFHLALHSAKHDARELLARWDDLDVNQTMAFLRERPLVVAFLPEQAHKLLTSEKARRAGATPDALGSLLDELYKKRPNTGPKGLADALMVEFPESVAVRDGKIHVVLVGRTPKAYPVSGLADRWRRLKTREGVPPGKRGRPTEN